MKRKVDKEKLDVKSGSLNPAKHSQTKKVIVVLAFIIAGVLGINIISSVALNKTVEIVKLKTAVPQDGRLVDENMYKDTMSVAEYEKNGYYTFSDGTKKRSIVLWEDKDKIKDAYASYYLRQDSQVYWDSLSKETAKQYSYLYKMDGELLKIDIKADEFGEMLVPGDHINVRASYTEQVYSLPEDDEYAELQSYGLEAESSLVRQVKLFNNASVLDILNGSGESIFDIYYELLALPKSQQLAKLEDEAFLESTKPVQILLNVTPEEADNYMQIKSKSPTYMMTLLPRTSSNLITEALNELSK